jgi:TRAP-type mannitol/chloroaromatic compound transport system substrate-binding protein
MVKEKKSLKATKAPSRRKFFKTAAAAGAAAAASCSNAKYSNMQVLMLTVLKMQAAWPSGANIFFEMAGDYCKNG